MADVDDVDAHNNAIAFDPFEGECVVVVARICRVDREAIQMTKIDTPLYIGRPDGLRDTLDYIQNVRGEL